jgi:two-component system sensor histidine kinase UhpB
MLVLGLLGTISIVLLEAQSRITAEITSGMELGHDLATDALHDAADAETPAAAFEQLNRDLPHVRHVLFELHPADTRVARDLGVPASTEQFMERSWVARLLAPPPVEQTLPVIVRGIHAGILRVQSDSANEIAEIIDEVDLFAGALAVLGLLLLGGLLWTVHRALRPLQVLADGFDRLEHGDYLPIPPIAVSELQRIGRQFNHLAESLQQVTLDNHFLIDKLLSLQEEEKKALAADLHDEFGPVLFGIRADAACIMRSVPHGTEVHARAQSIAGLADGIQKVNYRILDSLRPLVLEQLGLRRALQQQASTWRRVYPQIAWTLELSEDFDDPSEAASFMLYRAAQETAINAVRHACASAVTVSLGRRPADGTARAFRAHQTHCFLSVRDNGKGLPDNFRRGFGLLGLAERVRQLGGTLAFRRLDPGLAIEITIPESERQATLEVAHASSADR